MPPYDINNPGMLGAPSTGGGALGNTPVNLGLGGTAGAAGTMGPFGLPAGYFGAFSMPQGAPLQGQPPQGNRATAQAGGSPAPVPGPLTTTQQGVPGGTGARAGTSGNIVPGGIGSVLPQFTTPLGGGSSLANIGTLLGNLAQPQRGGPAFGIPLGAPQGGMPSLGAPVGGGQMFGGAFNPAMLAPYLNGLFGRNLATSYPTTYGGQF